MSDHDMEAKVQDILLETARGRDARFSAGFAGRVMARLERDRKNNVADALAWQTRRLLPALMAASLALVAWNWTTTHAVSESVVDAALGFAPAAVASSTGFENAELFQ